MPEIEKIELPGIRKIIEEALKSLVTEEEWYEGIFPSPEHSAHAAPLFGISRALATVSSQWRNETLCNKWAEKLRSYQRPDGIWDFGPPSPSHLKRYRETDFIITNTSHAVKTLNILNARPRYSIYLPPEVLTSEGLIAYLEGVQWDTQWGTSIPPGNLCMCYIANGMWSLADTWFDWIDSHSDPESGWWFPEIAEGEHVIGGAYHLMEAYICARRELPHTEVLLDSLMKLYDSGSNLSIPPDKRPSCGPLDIGIMLCECAARLGLSGMKLDKVKMVAYRYFRIYYDAHILRPEWKAKLNQDLNGAINPTACALAAGNWYLPEWFVDERPWWYNWASASLSRFPVSLT